MKTVQTLALACVAGLMAACGPLPDGASGPSFRAQNNRVVVPLISGGQFEVISLPGDAGPAFFCAAADYAYVKLGARPVDRVVLVAPVGAAVTRAGRSAIFNVEPGQTPISPSRSGITINMRKTGENLSVAHSRALCGNTVKFPF